MKHLRTLILTLSTFFACASAYAQPVSQASFLRAVPKTDVTVPFRVLDEGIVTPIEWGLDLAWLSEDNIRCGITYAGKDIIEIIRTSYMPTESVEGGALSSAQISKIRQRANIIKKYAKSGVSLNLNDDHASVDAWYNASNVTSAERGKRWAQVIDLHIKKYAELGLTNFVSISPYNEPDYGWDQGLSSSRKADFLNTCKSLRNDFDGAYDGVRLCGGNTLNDDMAYEWWNYLKAQLDEGNTHQLAGSFDNYASFFQKVRAYGHHATADELHNTMEAMVGVEYGMQTGIWWGTCEHSRSQFMKATWQGNPGRRLGYGEHRNNWTAASVYRHANGQMQAFGGTSERQGVETTYGFVSLDCPVWYNGLLGRQYQMHLPGGTGYQTGQTNAETVIDVQSGPDIMPHIDGTYKIMNVNSGHLMGLASNPSNWTSVTQRRNGTANILQWQVTPVPETIGGDFSYYYITLNTGKGMVLDILNWNLNAGADVGVFQGGLGTNEQWYLEYADSGAFYIRSRFSTKCLEVKGGSSAVSANVQMGEFSGAKYQQWRFIPIDASPDLIAPDAPTNLVAEGQSASVMLKWQPSGAKDVASYTILRSTDGENFYTIATGLTEPAFVDNEAQDGQTYIYQVRAQDHSLNYSPLSNTAKASTTGEPDQLMYLAFDQSFADATPHANHCALWGDTTWVDAKNGPTGISLDGSNNFLQLPYTIANHKELTVACWTYWRGGNTWQRLWDFGNDTDHYLFLTPSSGSGIRFAIKNGGSEQQLTSSSRLTPNTWAHVAVTIGADAVTLYVNGQSVVSSDKITIRPDDINPVLNYIGRSQFAADPMYKGTIDDFRIYNYALTAEEVAALADYTDGIDEIVDSKSFARKSIYDLSGRRVPTSSLHHFITPSLPKGIYIRDGKKIAVIE